MGVGTVISWIQSSSSINSCIFFFFFVEFSNGQSICMYSHTRTLLLWKMRLV